MVIPVASMVHRSCLAQRGRSPAWGRLVAASPGQENFPCLPPNPGEQGALDFGVSFTCTRGTRAEGSHRRDSGKPEAFRQVSELSLLLVGIIN